MDLNVLTYLIYLALALPLTLWVARALHRYGEVFLLDVFEGNDDLAHAVNQLLVIGFYLLNLGYVALFMTSHAKVDTTRKVFEVLSTKVGGVALVIGVVHFGNVWAFNALRRRAVQRARVAPPAPPAYGPSYPPPAYPPPEYPPPAYPPPAYPPPPGWAGWTAPGSPVAPEA